MELNLERYAKKNQGNVDPYFSELLRSIKNPARKEIAYELKIPYSTYDNYLRGFQVFPKERLFELYEITGDTRIIQHMFRGKVGLVKNSESVRKAENLLSRIVGAIQDLTEDALEDGIVEIKEYLPINKRIMKLCHAAEKLDEILRHMVGVTP